MSFLGSLCFLTLLSRFHGGYLALLCLFCLCKALFFLFQLHLTLMLEICFFLELLTAGVFQVSVKSVLGSCLSCSLRRRYGRTRNWLSFCFRLFCLGSFRRLSLSLRLLGLCFCLGSFRRLSLGLGLLGLCFCLGSFRRLSFCLFFGLLSGNYYINLIFLGFIKVGLRFVSKRQHLAETLDRYILFVNLFRCCLGLLSLSRCLWSLRLLFLIIILAAQSNSHPY